MTQSALMKFDPVTGNPNPYPSHAAQYRSWHGLVAWLINPWTGTKRDARDIGSDIQGLLIQGLSDASIAITPARDGLPKIGEPWPGHGGIYCGISRGEEGQPDAHLILADLAPDRDFTWEDALEFAKTVEADGHADFHVPTRFESALLYANVRDQMDTDRWHWTSTQYSEYNAFIQYFSYGAQYTAYKNHDGRVRFVRLVPL